MNDVDLDGLASDLGFVLKVEQKEAVESHLRGKDVFGVLPTDGLWKKPDISAVCFDEKQSFQLAKCFSRTVNKIDRLNTTDHVYFVHPSTDVSVDICRSICQSIY